MDIKNHITHKIDMEVHENVDLKKYNTMQIPATGAFLAVCHTVDGIQEAIEFARRIGRPWMLLGGGSNVIFTCDFVDAVLIKLSEAFEYINFSDSGSLIVGAATDLPLVVDFAIGHNIAGFVPFWGIPGTLGGAIAGNAGADEAAMGDVLKQVTVLDSSLMIQHIDKDNILRKYRSCELAETIILEARCKATTHEGSEVQEKLHDVRRNRALQPRMGREPSAGCIFKNPDGDYAGRLIDAAGLKAKSIGGAKVSEIHANFIVNTGDATPEDVVKLIEFVRDCVEERFAVQLEPEVKFFGMDKAGQKVG